ncbi:hypothetical protein D9M70_440350 [compost metagenome]
MSESLRHFSAVGWTLEVTERPPSMDTILDYMEREASRLPSESLTSETAAVAAHIGDHARRIRNELGSIGERPEWLDPLLFLAFNLGLLAAHLEHEQVRPHELLAQGLNALQADRKRLAGLALQNASKEEVKQMARELAVKLWDADSAQEIRIGDMAEKVYRTLASTDALPHLPGTVEPIHDWIRPVAPAYARKRGRKKK